MKFPNQDQHLMTHMNFQTIYLLLFLFLERKTDSETIETP